MSNNLKAFKVSSVITKDTGTSFGQQQFIAVTVYQKLCYLVHNDDETWEKDIQIEVSEFDNCREYGFQYRVLNGKQDVSFTVYEHRNSDRIIINGCKTEDIQSYGAYLKGGSSRDYLASFGYEEYNKVTDQLFKFLVQTYNGTFDETILDVNKKD
jgi:hypothetical protein